MIEHVFHVIVAFFITKAAPNLDLDKAKDITRSVVHASIKHEVDPVLVVSIMWHESGFRNLPVNRTNDRGLMQVHWSPGAPWLQGLSQNDLLRPDVNIRAGVHELAWWRAQHVARCNVSSDHFWWAHYKWGYHVKNRKYGKAVYKKLKSLGT